jgi:hypothetical protein
MDFILFALDIAFCHPLTCPAERFDLYSIVLKVDCGSAQAIEIRFDCSLLHSIERVIDRTFSSEHPRHDRSPRKACRQHRSVL